MKFRFLLIVTIFLSFLACNNNKFDVDVSTIEVNLDVKRLDLDVMKNYPDTPDVYQLIADYGKFLDLYSYQVLQIGGVNQRDYPKLLLDFTKYCQDYQIPVKVENALGDFSKSKKALENAFKYYKYYFPEKQVPQFYTYFSNFSQSIITDSALIGIGVDKYLGTDCELYGRLGFDSYKIRKMHSGMLVVDCMRAIAMSEFEFNDSIDNLLSHIVHEGKIQYFLDAMLPFTSDTLKFGYTKDQFDWAEYNEDKMWSYLIEHQLLFSTDAIAIRKMVGDGPFTTLFANNSAPRAGAFLGWKIVYQYMENNPEVDLPKLMENTDYQGILNSAKYKP
jgi:hypothetical protein